MCFSLICYLYLLQEISADRILREVFTVVQSDSFGIQVTPELRTFICKKKLSIATMAMPPQDPNHQSDDDDDDMASKQEEKEWEIEEVLGVNNDSYGPNRVLCKFVGVANEEYVEFENMNNLAKKALHEYASKQRQSRYEARQQVVRL